MSNENKETEKDAGEGINSYLTNDERTHLLANLHRLLNPEMQFQFLDVWFTNF